MQSEIKRGPGMDEERMKTGRRVGCNMIDERMNNEWRLNEEFTSNSRGYAE